jgi:AraC family cel operon transcriptional repressor
MEILGAHDILSPDGFHVAETVIEQNTRTFVHSHDFYEIFLVTSGYVYHCINGREELLSDGTLYLVYPRDVHSYRTDQRAPASFQNLAFTPEIFSLVKDLFESYGGIANMSRKVLLPAMLREAVYIRLLYPFCSMGEIFKLPRRNMLIGVLLDCFCFLKGQSPSGVSAPAWLFGACEALRKNHNYVGGIKRFVKLSGKTQEHLTRSMKKYYNTTPSAYVNGLRLGEAVRLLKVSNLKVLDIQLECGFNNASHFNALFRTEFGVSPSRYRCLNRAVITEPLAVYQ